jgi:hypothetical protein
MTKAENGKNADTKAKRQFGVFASMCGNHDLKAITYNNRQS